MPNNSKGNNFSGVILQEWHLQHNFIFLSWLVKNTTGHREHVAPNQSSLISRFTMITDLSVLFCRNSYFCRMLHCTETQQTPRCKSDCLVFTGLFFFPSKLFIVSIFISKPQAKQICRNATAQSYTRAPRLTQ